MSQLLLDTNAFIRILNGSLPRKVERLVFKSSSELLLSVATPWEIAIKRSLQKAGFSRSLVMEKIDELGARLLSITIAHANAIYDLPLHHAEPFDRIIIAQALVEQCAVISSDQRFPMYASSGLKVIWE